MISREQVFFWVVVAHKARKLGAAMLQGHSACWPDQAHHLTVSAGTARSTANQPHLPAMPPNSQRKQAAELGPALGDRNEGPSQPTLCLALASEICIMSKQ